jgi:3-hydroxyisobutyrate dehydrogenase-like beta-hydroxyacid dehydrogenase
MRLRLLIRKTFMTDKILLIGLGKMGTAIATRILEGGFPLAVYNRTPGKTAALLAKGAKEVTDLSEAIAIADIVITCLLDDAAVLNIVTAEKTGILQNLKKGGIHVGISTILPATSIQLSNMHTSHDSYYLAANVLGVPQAALVGKLTALVAGDNNLIDKIEPILKTFAENIMRVGEKPEHANVMKVSINYTLMTAIELISELYVYSEKNNMDLSFIQDMLHNIFSHPAFKLYIDKIKARDFDRVNFDLRGGAKDIGIFQKAFTTAGVSPELANVVSSRFIAALAQGMEKKDWSSIYEIIRTEAGLM